MDITIDQLLEVCMKEWPAEMLDSCNCVYIRFSTEKFTVSRSSTMMAPGKMIIVDMDEQGKVLGIELI